MNNYSHTHTHKKNINKYGKVANSNARRFLVSIAGGQSPTYTKNNTWNSNSLGKFALKSYGQKNQCAGQYVNRDLQVWLSYCSCPCLHLNTGQEATSAGVSLSHSSSGERPLSTRKTVTAADEYCCSFFWPELTQSETQPTLSPCPVTCLASPLFSVYLRIS